MLLHRTYIRLSCSSRNGVSMFNCWSFCSNKVLAADEGILDDLFSWESFTFTNIHSFFTFLNILTRLLKSNEFYTWHIFFMCISESQLQTPQQHVFSPFLLKLAVKKNTNCDPMICKHSNAWVSLPASNL